MILVLYAYDGLRLNTFYPELFLFGFSTLVQMILDRTTWPVMAGDFWDDKI